MSPDHAHEVRRLAEALRQYADAAEYLAQRQRLYLAKLDEPTFRDCMVAEKVHATALVEVLAVGRQVVLTANLDGTFTSPLLGGT